MKTVHKTKELRAELAKLGNVPGVSKTVPETNILRIVADLDGVSLIRNTPQASLITKVDGSVDDEGEVAVKYSDFVSIISRMGGDAVTLELGKKSLGIASWKSEASLAFLKPETTPVISISGDFEETQFMLEEIIEIMRSAAAHSSKLEADNALCGVSIQSDGKAVWFCGCDRKRLFQGNILPTRTINLNIVVPASVGDSLAAAFPEGNGAVTMRASDNAILFGTNQTQAVYSLLNAAYPNAQQLIDHVEKQEITNTIKANRQDLIRMVGIVAPFGEGEYRAITLQGEKGELVLTGDNHAGAEFRHKLGATCDPGDPIQFNPAYLKDLLGSMLGAAVEIRQFGMGITISEPGRKGFISAIKKE